MEGPIGEQYPSIGSRSRARMAERTEDQASNGRRLRILDRMWCKFIGRHDAKDIAHVSLGLPPVDPSNHPPIPNTREREVTSAGRRRQ
jgi:hypothetical protein